MLDTEASQVPGLDGPLPQAAQPGPAARDEEAGPSHPAELTEDQALIPFLSRHSSTLDLLARLYSCERTDETTDPHLVDSYIGLALPDPGRDPDAQVSEMAQTLEQPLLRRTRELGRPLARRPWACTLRTVPGSRSLTDAEWAACARSVVHATGIAPDGDERACRWVAIRRGEDRMAIVALLMRQDGRWPHTRVDAPLVFDVCRALSGGLGLPELPTVDGPHPTVSAAELSSRRETTKELLQEAVRRVAGQTSRPDEFLDLLGRVGVRVLHNPHQSGEFALSLPGDRDDRGRAVWIHATELDERLTAVGLPDFLTSNAWEHTSYRPLPAPRPADDANLDAAERAEVDFLAAAA